MVRLFIFEKPRKEMHFSSAEEASRYADTNYIEDFFIIDESFPLTLIRFNDRSFSPLL